MDRKVYACNACSYYVVHKDNQIKEKAMRLEKFLQIGNWEILQIRRK